MSRVPGLDHASPNAHYLWHLHEAGVIRLSHEPGPLPRYHVEGAVWDTLYDGPVEPSLVAVIDNGCCSDHPHLPAGEAHLPAPCFASHDFGATHEEGDGTRGEEPVNHFDAGERDVPGFRDRLEDLAVRGERHAPMDRMRDILDGLRRTPGVHRHVNSYDEDFPVHGTLTAGVVAARPPAEPASALPYFGVDPRARVLSLNTAFRPDFLPLIHALLYAVGRGADVLAIPRAIWRPEPWEGEADPHRPDDLRATRLDTDPGLQVDAALFEVLLHVVGETIPVVMAAGNNGFARAQVYPARLAQDGNGLISVGALSGARAADGSALVSGYSNTRGVTIHAPSDDAEVWDGRRLRLDPEGRAAHDHPVPGGGEPFSPWSVLSTDIPGPYGNASGGMEAHRRDEPANRRSLFAPFGGTSAACAVVAGAASLVQAARRKAGEAPFTGPEMKRHMLRHCPTVARLDDGEPVVRIDARACLDPL